MNEADLIQYITGSFPGVETTDNFGYKFFFVGPDRMRPFASLANADYDYDRFSDLDRPGVYRLNMGVRRDSFERLFGASRVNVSEYDYTVLDRIMPHPEYAAQFFVCVLNPGEATLEAVKGLLAEAHEIAAQRHEKTRKDAHLPGEAEA